jgi:hypothetical protein
MQTYSSLQSFVADFLARDDLTTQIPTFISLAEQRMSRELQIALLERVAQSNVSANQQFIALPTDLRGIRELARVDADGTRTALRYLTPAQLDVRKLDGTNPTATTHYSISANDIELYAVPTAETTIEIIYDEGVKQLSSTVTTNTMLTRHGDAYLHGTLKYAFDFLQDEQRSMYHDAQFTRCLAEIDRDSDKQRFGQDLQVRRANESSVF